MKKSKSQGWVAERKEGITHMTQPPLALEVSVCKVMSDTCRFDYMPLVPRFALSDTSKLTVPLKRPVINACTSIRHPVQTCNTV